jgi:hypothetical protein
MQHTRNYSLDPSYIGLSPLSQTPPKKLNYAARMKLFLRPDLYRRITNTNNKKYHFSLFFLKHQLFELNYAAHKKLFFGPELYRYAGKRSKNKQFSPPFLGHHLFELNCAAHKKLFLFGNELYRDCLAFDYKLN